MSFRSDVSTESSLMVAVNAEIDRLHRSFGLAESDFFCECGDAACKERVTIGRAEFAELRSRSARVVTPAHGDRVRSGEQEPALGELIRLDGVLAARARIGRAARILATRGEMTEDDALEALRRRARKANRSLDEICSAYLLEVAQTTRGACEVE